MKSDLFLRSIPHELPAMEVQVKITQCLNRFEVLVKPGAEIDVWAVQAILARWAQNRIDDQNPQGHNHAELHRMRGSDG